MSSGNSNDSFMKRWSDRKAEHQRGQAIDTADNTAISTDEAITATVTLEAAVMPPLVLDPHGNDPHADGRADSLPATGVEQGQVAHDEVVLSDADMPPVESLVASSDVSAFFNKGVSAALRKAALRHVFQQPQFNVRDGLNDYDGDYTVFEPLGDTITADMKFHTARKERDRLAAEAEEERLAAEAVEEERLRAGEADAELAGSEHADADLASEQTDALPEDAELTAGNTMDFMEGESAAESGQPALDLAFVPPSAPKHGNARPELVQKHDADKRPLTLTADTSEQEEATSPVGKQEKMT